MLKNIVYYLGVKFLAALQGNVYVKRGRCSALSQKAPKPQFFFGEWGIFFRDSKTVFFVIIIRILKQVIFRKG